jgi:hypothetical protein
MSRKSFALLNLLFMLILTITACPDPMAFVTQSALPTPTTIAGTEVPFDTLVQHEYSSYIGTEPLMFLITNLEETQPVMTYLSLDQEKEQLQSLDFTQYIAITLFRGTHASSGYEAKIDRIIRQDHELHVYAEFWEPGLGYPTNSAAMSFYQIVKLSRQHIDSQPLQVVLHHYPMLHR